MKNKLDFNVRAGKHVDMVEMLDRFEKTYEHNLESTIQTYDSYEEISNETYNDMTVCVTCLRLLEELGYIEKDELDNMTTYAEEMRLSMLKELERIECIGTDV